MMERTSERIWRAARAAYESRGQLKTFLPWDDLRQVSRDIEYDAMVAALEAVDALWQMGPEAPSPPQRVVKAVAQAIFDRAERTDLAEARVCELEAAAHPLPKDIQRLLIDLAATDVPLAPGWASVVLRARAAIEVQAARIAVLEAELERCRTPTTPPDFENILDAAGKIKDARIAELEAEVRRLQNNEENDCDLLGAHERRIAELEVDRDHQKVLAERFMTAEHQLSDAYLRLREMIPGALDLEIVPDLRYGDNVPWAHTEACLKRMVNGIAELEAAGDDARACVNMLMLCGEEDGKHKDEKPAAYLRRLIDAIIKAEARIAELEVAIQRRNGNYRDLEVHLANAMAALKPFAEYAERIEKEHASWHHDQFTFHIYPGADISMAWFIAALKAYRGEPAPPAEDKT